MSGAIEEVPVRGRRRSAALSVGAITVMLATVISGLAPSFASLDYLVPAIGGVVLGIIVGALCTRFRFGMLATAACTLAVYAVFGGALALPATTLWGLPTLDTLIRLAVGAVDCWKRMVTAAPPLLLSDGHGLVPFILMLVAAVLAVSLALRMRHGVWALLPTVSAAAIAAALGTSQPSLAVAQGVIFAATAVAWLAIRHGLDPSRNLVQVQSEAAPKHLVGTRVWRVLSAAAILLVAAEVSIFTSPLTMPSPPRAVLRDIVQPPLQLHTYVSPLQSFRHYVRDRADEAQFTVDGLPVGARLRLATLDTYTGTVMNVSDTGRSGSGRFTPLRSDTMQANPADGRVTVTVTVDDYDDVWVPTVGTVYGLQFAGADADDLRRGSFINDVSKTVVSTRGLRTGDSYTLEVAVPVVSEAQLGQALFAPVDMPPQQQVPDGFAELAAATVMDADTPIEQVRALQTMLTTDGFFSHGLDGSSSLSGHGAARLQAFLDADVMVGDDEQYAVAMALLAGTLQIPVRVVMGWYPDPNVPSDGRFVADGSNVHAWVEVAFDGLGWVPFDVTPPEDKEPFDDSERPRADQKPQVLQPPPPPQEPAEEPPVLGNDQQQDDEESEHSDAAVPVGVLVALSAGGLLMLLLLPVVVIVAVKAARLRRRLRAPRAADRVAGGWQEVVDHAVDLRVPVEAGATRAETAMRVEAAFAGVPIRALAQRADIDVFGPGDPSDDEAAAFWQASEAVKREMGRARKPWVRMRAKISVRSFFGRQGRQASSVGRDVGDGAREQVGNR